MRRSVTLTVVLFLAGLLTAVVTSYVGWSLQTFSLLGDSKDVPPDEVNYVTTPVSIPITIPISLEGTPAAAGDGPVETAVPVSVAVREETGGVEAWVAMLIIVVCGMVGGIGNALLGEDKGIVLPHRQALEAARIWRPGIVGNVFIGALAAFIGWAINSPVSQTDIASRQTITIGTVGGALLVGMAGARWLTTEVDKRVLQAASTTTAPAAGTTTAATVSPSTT